MEMETITPSNYKIMKKQQSIIDFISAGSKSEKTILRNKKKGTDYGKGDVDASSFQNYLKETVEKNAPAEKVNNKDVKEENETTYDVEYIEYDEETISPYNVSNFLLENEKSETLTEININRNISGNGLIQGNQGKYLSDLLDNNELAVMQQWERESLNTGTMIYGDENVNSETMSEMMEDISRAKTSNTDFPLLKEINGDQNQVSPDEKGSKIKNAIQFSQLNYLNSQNMQDEVEISAYQENYQTSYLQQQVDVINAAKNSRTLKQTELNDKSNYKGGLSVVQNMKKDTVNENYFFSEKSDTTEKISNVGLGEASVRNDNFNDNREMKNNQGLYILEHSDSEKIVTNQFVALDNKSFTLKSGDPKVINPQVLMDQIIKGGTQVIQKGSGRVRMTLNPPNLGSLDMDVQVKNNKVEVLFIADTKEIQQSLQANADLLKTALNQHGLKIDGFNVLLQGNTDHSNGGYYSGESALWRDSRSGTGKEDTRKDQSKKEDTTVNINVKNKIGQYSISLFI